MYSNILILFLYAVCYNVLISNIDHFYFKIIKLCIFSCHFIRFSICFKQNDDKMYLFIFGLLFSKRLAIALCVHNVIRKSQLNC